MSEFKIEGLAELSKKLSEFGPKIGSKYLRSALMTAALPVVKAAKADIPKGSKSHKTYKGRLVGQGFAARNIAKRSSLSRDKQTAFVRIGVKREAYYAISFLELGTKNLPKRPWLTRALEQQKNAVVARFADRLKKKIEQVAKS